MPSCATRIESQAGSISARSGPPTPPDPLIYLKARLYHPQDWDKTRGELDDMVARMREIAACLDVTGRELEHNADGTPKLTGCKTGAGS